MRRGLLAVRRTLLALALVALVLGLGDRDGVAPQATPELDVIVAVDRTTSMSALDDASGSRITAVRRDLVDLADQMGPARFSVVTFGESAALRVPFTSDRDSYQDEVAAIQVERAADGVGSSVGRGVPLLERLLRRAAKSSVERLPVLVFVTDGENTSPDEQASFRRLGRLTVASVVLGYGTDQGAEMPLERVGLDSLTPPASDPGSVVTDRETGQPAVSRLDAANLEQIASELGGPYLRVDAAGSMAEVAAQLAETAYADLEPGRPQRELRWLWALLVLALVLPELRTGWRSWLQARREGS